MASPGDVNRHPETAISGFIGGRDLNKSRIDGKSFGFDNPWYLGNTAWNQIHTSCDNKLTGHPGGKKGLEAVVLVIKLF